MASKRVDGGSIAGNIGTWKLFAHVEQEQKCLNGKKVGRNIVQKSVSINIERFLSGIRDLREFIYPPRQSLKRVFTTHAELNLRRVTYLGLRVKKVFASHPRPSLRVSEFVLKETTSGQRIMSGILLLTGGFRGIMGVLHTARIGTMVSFLSPAKALHFGSSGRLNINAATGGI